MRGRKIVGAVVWFEIFAIVVIGLWTPYMQDDGGYPAWWDLIARIWFWQLIAVLVLMILALLWDVFVHEGPTRRQLRRYHAHPEDHPYDHAFTIVDDPDTGHVDTPEERERLSTWYREVFPKHRAVGRVEMVDDPTWHTDDAHGKVIRMEKDPE